MAGKCCKSETGSGCPAMQTGDCSKPCEKKRSYGCKICDALGIPPCVAFAAAAVALVGVAAAVTVQYNKRK